MDSLADRGNTSILEWIWQWYFPLTHPHWNIIVNVRTCTLPLYCFPAVKMGYFIQLYKNNIRTMQHFNQVTHVQFDITLQLEVHSANIRIFTSTGSLILKHLRWTFSHPTIFLGGWSPSPLFFASTPSPSQIHLIQHIASACDNTHTVVHSRQK